MDSKIEQRCLYSELQLIELKSHHDKKKRILDIGGGGEGIIGRLYGCNVVSIDKLEEELIETENESLKIVMDASEMTFLNNSFDIATMFFTLLYMPLDVKVSVIEECSRVLKKNGILEIWDISIPGYDEGEKDIFVADLKILLPDETVNTQYGRLMEEEAQTKHLIIKLCEETGMRLVKSKDIKDSFYLMFQK